MEHRTFLDALDAQKEAQDFLLATVLEGQQQGTALLLCDGQVAWTSAPETLLTQNLSALKKCTTSGVFTLGDTRVFAERFGAGARLVICGGGHVAAAAVRLAKLLDLPVTGLEDRPEYADALRETGADRVLCAPFETSLAQIPGSTETYFCVLTRAHAYDITCLKQILQKPAAYVGMMGSRGRSELVRRQLAEAGLDPARVARLHAPIGLAIGAKTAQEIALSILAQIVEIKSHRQLTEGFTPEIRAAWAQCRQEQTDAVLATIVSRHGSMPREVGTKMLILPDGSTAGSVGGGIMEYRARQLAEKMLAGTEAASRRQVSLCEAVYEGETTVEGLRAVRISKQEEAEAVWAQNAVPVLIDPKGESIRTLKPDVVVDAILAKKKLGTTREMAPLTIALGPGFTAGQDVDVVVETKRGHKLGRIIREGAATPNTGVPGVIGGYAAERVLHSSAQGIFRDLHAIGDFVEAGEAIAKVETPEGEEVLVKTQIAGILRGLLRDGYPVVPGFKVADVDPRKTELENCFLISDKARCIAGSVLELVVAQLWK